MGKVSEKAGFARYARIAMLGSVGMMTCLATIARAQEAPEGVSESTLGEIVVTARKTSENVQDVPLTVNVISGEALDAKGVGQLSNVAALVSNMMWIDAGGGTFTNSITLRGIASNATSQGFDPGVAVYVDEVYVGNQFGFNSALLDVNRIEVLKGPQGTLFGRNSAAGAISMHTKRPSTDAFSLTADVRAGNVGLVQTRALVNVPISDQAAIKFSGIYKDRDGYQRNILNGRRDLNDEHFYGGKAQLLLTPSPDLDILGTVEHFKNDDHQDIYSCASPGGFLPCPNLTPESVFVNIAADNNSITRRSTWAGSLQMDWHAPGGFDLTSISAYRSLHVQQDQDQDYTVLDFLRSGFAVPKDWQFSQELRLATDQTKRLRGVLGLYYFQEDRDTNIPLIFTADLLNSFFGTTLTENMVQTTKSQLQTKSYAIFGQGQFELTPEIIFEAGLRYTKDKKHFDYSQTLSPNITDVPVFIQEFLNLIAVPRDSASASFSKATYTTSLSWKPTDQIMAYVRYATGYKAGGFQAATYSADYNPLVPFNPENSGQFEVGVKTDSGDGRLRFNASAFLTDYKDIQVQITNADFEKIIGNFGSARARGFELEASALVTDGVTLDGTFGLQRSRFRSGPFDGLTFAYVPKVTASLSANYEHAISSNWVGSMSASATYRSAMGLNTDDPNDLTAFFLSSSGVTLINARLGFQQEGKGFGVYLWANNLTDERRFTAFRPQGPVLPASYQTSTPRTYGVEVKVTF